MFNDQYQSDVKVLAPAGEPNVLTSCDILRQTLTQEPFRSVVKKFRIRFGAHLGGGYYSDVFRVKLDEWKLLHAQSLKPGRNKMLIKIVYLDRCPKLSNYENELAICKVIHVGVIYMNNNNMCHHLNHLFSFQHFSRMFHTRI